MRFGGVCFGVQNFSGEKFLGSRAAALESLQNTLHLRSSYDPSYDPLPHCQSFPKIH